MTQKPKKLTKGNKNHKRQNDTTIEVHHKERRQGKESQETLTLGEEMIMQALSDTRSGSFTKVVRLYLKMTLDF